MKIHHIGYLVKNLLEAMNEFKKLGYVQITDTVQDNSRQITICFIEKDGYLLELISPFGVESPFYGLLKKHKNSPYHICYISDCFESDIEMLLNNGYMLFQPPSEAIAIGNRKVCFMINPEIGIIELLDNRMPKGGGS